MFASVYNESLIKTTYQYLSVLVGFDTAMHPLYMWVITDLNATSLARRVGDLYIRVFRSRESSGALDGRLRRLEGPKSTGGAPRGLARHPCSFFLPDSVYLVSKI